MTALSPDQPGRLLETTRDQPFYPLWTVLGTAGLRLGEAIGLMWEDIDLNEGELPKGGSNRGCGCSPG